MIKKLFKSFKILFRVLGVTFLHTLCISFVVAILGALASLIIHILSYFNLTYIATICIGMFALLFILCFLIFGINEIINIKNGY